MLDGSWSPGKGHRAIAKKYGIKLATAREWAAESGRYLRMVFGQEEDVRERILAHLDEYLALAGHDVRAIYDLQAKEWATYEIVNLPCLFKGIELKAKIHGLLARPAEEARREKQDVPLDEVVRLLEAQGIQCVKDGKPFNPRTESERFDEEFEESLEDKDDE